MNAPLDHALARLCAAHPRFVPSVTPTPAMLADVSWAELIPAAISAGKQQFLLDNDKHAAQLWLYTLLGDVLSPAMVLMVQEGVFADVDVTAQASGGGGFFSRDDHGYWFGFRPHRELASAAEVGRSLGAWLPGLVGELATIAGMRTAPLWAVIVDGFVQPLMGAGNEEFETVRALTYADQLWQGLAQETGVGLPQPRFAQVAEGQVLEIPKDLLESGGLGDGDEPEFIFSHRVSCCMIYHSPKAGLCTSCPHQDKQQRLAGIIEAAQSY